MTPAERVAELRRLYESDKCWSSTDLTRAENTERLILALAEAVPAALEGKTDALAAAWAALGDGDHE